MCADMEMVYVVDRDVLFREVKCYPQGFISAGPLCPDDGETFRKIIPSIASGYFVERRVAEQTPSMKQIIPYCVMTSEHSHQRTVWLMRRSGGGEKRLDGASYIGVGGHINPCDATQVLARSGYVEEWALHRELQEELRFYPLNADDDAASGEVSYEEWRRLIGPNYPVPIGIINDDSNPVGAVHLGLVYHLPVPSGWMPVTEDRGHWEFVSTIRQMQTGVCETWTQLIINGGAL